MHSIETVRTLHEWLRWTIDRTLASCRDLSEEERHRRFEIGLGSVHETLVHLCWAESLWIGVITDTVAEVPDPTLQNFPDLDALEAAWPRARAKWATFLDAVTPEEFERIMTRERNGRVFRQRVLDGCLQVPTHALYHMAQLSFMFRAMGRTGESAFPDSSYVNFARERLGEG